MVFFFEEGQFKAVERTLPVSGGRFHPGPGVGHGLFPPPDVTGPSPLLGRDQPGTFQGPEVLKGARKGEVERPGQVAD